MLKLKNIKKTYRVGEIETKALDDISVSFREKEFVAILGTSGSGKTTCLNIIGGLDNYNSGDLVIKGKSTKHFKESDWDAYRNNTIGFVFQSYNLISHLSIVANVELGMTLSGVSKKEKNKKALEVLEKVGLKDHLHKKPNQLSGGQMQRVAIARALANNPEILLCDEPTGALDTKTSIQIMDLIQELSKERLVIMVTHNPELAEKYTERIIRFSDGHIIDDTNPYDESSKYGVFNLKKTSMKLRTAIRLSFNNLRTKKGRTFLTAFASSIGVIGIAVILSLSTGFQREIDNYQTETLSEFPIMISRTLQEVDEDELMERRSEMMNRDDEAEDEKVPENIVVRETKDVTYTHQNDFSIGFIDYIHKLDPAIASNIGYTRLVNMNVIGEVNGEIMAVNFGAATSAEQMQAGMLNSRNGSISSFPSSIGEASYLENNFDIIAGDFPTNENDLVLIIDENNSLDVQFLQSLGFDVENSSTLTFDDVIGKTYQLVGNNEYYEQTSLGNFVPSMELENVYNNQNNETLTIRGVIRAQNSAALSLVGSGLAYSDELAQKVIDNAMQSDIVKAQEEADYNVITMQAFESDENKEHFLAYLGGDEVPFMISIYPTDFSSKDEVLDYIDAYNEGKEQDDIIIYTDLAGTISDLSSGIMDGITVVLIAFASISLVVSMIMICIITYTSVIERTKEIGVLKALGARKKDITRVFDAETLLLGVFSGTLGVLIAYALTFPINMIISDMAGLTNASQLQFIHAVILVIISTVLTVIGGHIPARMAAKKDAVEALRAE
jgi:putative ABC transport system permease protein